MTATARRILDRLPELAPFQRRFLAGAFGEGVEIGLLAAPRGSGKSTLSGWILSETIDPLGALYVPGGQSVLVSSSRDQSGECFGAIRDRLGVDGYSYQDTGQRMRVTRKACGTTIRVASSDPRRAVGISRARCIVLDEPASFGDRSGAAMWNALTTSTGKRELTIIGIGTKAGPAGEGGWWRSLVEAEPDPSTFVQVHEAPTDDEGGPPALSPRDRCQGGSLPGAARA